MMKLKLTKYDKSIEIFIKYERFFFQSKLTVDRSRESKKVFEDFRETVTKSITEITEPIQMGVPNIQSDSQILSSSNAEQVITDPREGISTDTIESSLGIFKTSGDNMNNDSSKDIEQILSFLLDSSKEDTFTATAIVEEKSDGQFIKDSVSADTTHDERMCDRTEFYDSCVSDKVSLVLDTTYNAAEKTNKKKETQETIFVRTSPSEIQVK